jgi:ABC-type dipeptide/oligopeptide/nickel transport system permease subunit
VKIKRPFFCDTFAPALAVGLLVLTVLAGPFLVRQSPYQSEFAHVLQAPSLNHWLGTDELGRDMTSRILRGARMSLLIAATVQSAAALLGILVGLIAGYSNRMIDGVLMSLVDVMYGFPALVIVIVLVAVLPPGVPSLIAALTFVSWALPASVMRSKVMLLRNEEYVVAAQALGASRVRILFRHVLPNAIGPMIVLFTQGAAATIISESALSYMGLGLPTSYPTLGGMIAKGRDYLLGSPHVALVPTCALVLTILCINRLGNALRLHLDPRLQRFQN